MIAVKFLGHNTVFAKDQEEYKQLPAYASDGIVLTNWELTDPEIKKLEETNMLKLNVLVFNRPAQPITVSSSRPSFPFKRTTKLMINPHSFDGNMATFDVVVIPAALAEIKKTRRIWITTVTYGGPLQPINGKLG